MPSRQAPCARSVSRRGAWGYERSGSQGTCSLLPQGETKRYLFRATNARQPERLEKRVVGTSKVTPASTKAHLRALQLTRQARAWADFPYPALHSHSRVTHLLVARKPVQPRSPHTRVTCWRSHHLPSCSSCLSRLGARKAESSSHSALLEGSRCWSGAIPCSIGSSGFPLSGPAWYRGLV